MLCGCCCVASTRSHQHNNKLLYSTCIVTAKGFPQNIKPKAIKIAHNFHTDTHRVLYFLAAFRRDCVRVETAVNGSREFSIVPSHCAANSFVTVLYSSELSCLS